MGQAILCCFVVSLGLIPTAVHMERVSLMVVSGVISLVPLFILYQPAHVSTFCDDLLGKKHSGLTEPMERQASDTKFPLADQLNDVSFLGDESHKERCMYLRHSWMNLNRGQGLGFKVRLSSAGTGGVSSGISSEDQD